MAQKICEKQQQLMDVFYGEETMTEALKQHLETCPSCEAHWAGMQSMQSDLEAELAKLTMDSQVDEGLIRGAFKKADGILEKRRNQRQFTLFVMVAVTILGMMATLVATGNTTILLYEQAFVTALTLISMPIVIHKRLKRGW